MLVVVAELAVVLVVVVVELAVAVVIIVSVIDSNSVG